MPTLEAITFHAVQRYADGRELGAGEVEVTPEMLGDLLTVVEAHGAPDLVGFVSDLCQTGDAQ